MNFILKYKGKTQPDLHLMNIILDAHQVQVLDDSLLPDCILVRLKESDITTLQTALQQEWIIYPEKQYRVPSTKKDVRKPL